MRLQTKIDICLNGAISLINDGKHRWKRTKRWYTGIFSISKDIFRSIRTQVLTGMELFYEVWRG